MAIASMDATDVTLRAVAPGPDIANRLTAALATAGITPQITHRDDSGDRTPIRNGDTLDIWGLFDHDLVILDFEDAILRSFLTDLPAHTKPDVRLFGTLAYVRSPLSASERDIALRFDTVIGSSEQISLLACTESGCSGLTDIHDRLRGVNLRAAIMIEDDDTFAIGAIDQPLQMHSLPAGSVNLHIPAIIAHAAVCVARREAWSTIATSLAENENVTRPILGQ